MPTGTVRMTAGPRLSTAVGDVFAGLGDVSAFAGRAITGLFTRHMKGRELLAQCVAVGVGSLGTVTVTGCFIGMVLAVQAYGQFHQLGLDTSLGAVIHMSVMRELGPVLTAVMLAGRVGGAMAAELGTMRVTEQIDALACLGVDPVRFLVAPRFLACLIMIPVLTIFADVMGLIGSTAICLGVYGIDGFHYWRHVRQYVGMWDVAIGVGKSVAFGGAVGLVACHCGFHTKAGAQGVGRSATVAFVAAFLIILALDFFLGLIGNGILTLVREPGPKNV